MATRMSCAVPICRGIQRAKLAQTSMPALLINRSTCLMACLVVSPRARAKAWPIAATASEAPVMTPSVAAERALMRLACRSGPYIPPRKSRTVAIRVLVRSVSAMDPVRLRMTGWSYATAANRGYGLPGKMRGFVRAEPAFN